MTHAFLSIYPAKLMEYGLAISYLLLFIPFWRYVQGGRREAPATVRAAVPARQEIAAAILDPAGAVALRRAAGWFHVPPGVHLHPGQPGRGSSRTDSSRSASARRESPPALRRRPGAAAARGRGRGARAADEP